MSPEARIWFPEGKEENVRIAIQHAGGKILEIQTENKPTHIPPPLPQRQRKTLEEQIRETKHPTALLYETVLEGLRHRHISATRASKEMGYAKGTLRAWLFKLNRMRTAPRKASLVRIANFLDLDPEMFFDLARKIKEENEVRNRISESQIPREPLPEKSVGKKPGIGILGRILRRGRAS